MNALATDMPDLDTLAAFRPWDGEAERKLRRRILRCQSVASARIKICRSEKALRAYWLALEVASEQAFAPSTTAELAEIVAMLARLFMVANALEVRAEIAGGDSD